MRRDEIGEIRDDVGDQVENESRRRCKGTGGVHVNRSVPLPESRA